MPPHGARRPGAFHDVAFDRAPTGDKVHSQTLCAMAQLDFRLIGAHDYAQLVLTMDQLGLGPDSRAEAFRRMGSTSRRQTVTITAMENLRRRGRRAASNGRAHRHRDLVDTVALSDSDRHEPCRWCQPPIGVYISTWGSDECETARFDRSQLPCCL